MTTRRTNSRSHIRERVLSSAVAVGLTVSSALVVTVLPISSAAAQTVSSLTVDQQEAALVQYGKFYSHPKYGDVWVPANVSSDWRPYSDCYWVYRDSAWFYDDPTPWGGIVHHYGRWIKDAQVGWMWTPAGEAFSPAWVQWKVTADEIGWMPLPPDSDIQAVAQTDDPSIWIVAAARSFGLPCAASSPAPIAATLVAPQHGPYPAFSTAQRPIYIPRAVSVARATVSTTGVTARSPYPEFPTQQSPVVVAPVQSPPIVVVNQPPSGSSKTLPPPPPPPPPPPAPKVTYPQGGVLQKGPGDAARAANQNGVDLPPLPQGKVIGKVGGASAASAANNTGVIVPPPHNPEVGVLNKGPTGAASAANQSGVEVPAPHYPQKPIIGKLGGAGGASAANKTSVIVPPPHNPEVGVLNKGPTGAASAANRSSVILPTPHYPQGSWLQHDPGRVAMIPTAKPFSPVPAPTPFHPAPSAQYGYGSVGAQAFMMPHASAPQMNAGASLGHFGGGAFGAGRNHF
jgi:hypothetical protein